MLAWEAGSCSVLQTGRTQRGKQILGASPVCIHLSRETGDVSDCRKISVLEVESWCCLLGQEKGREITHKE